MQHYAAFHQGLGEKDLSAKEYNIFLNASRAFNPFVQIIHSLLPDTRGIQKY